MNTRNKEASNTENSSDLPGFYYDPIKKKYFKIQSHNFGLQSVITNQSIKQKETLLKEQKNDLKKSKNLIDNLFLIQLGTFNLNLWNDLKIKYMKQTSLVKLEDSVQIKKINKFQMSTNDRSLYFLINISGYLNNLVQCYSINANDLKKNMSNVNYAPVSFNHMNESGEFYSISNTLRSSGLGYIQNNNYLVTDYYPSDSNTNKKQKISISYIDYYNRGQLNEKLICVKNFVLPMWCSRLNSNLSQNNQLNKLAIGFPKNGIVTNLCDDRYEQLLDSSHSDVYCVKFKPSVFL